MTSVLTPIATEQGSAPAAPLLTRPLVVVCAVNFTAMLAFYLLLTVVAPPPPPMPPRPGWAVSEPESRLVR